MENHFSALNPWNQKTFLGNMFVISITYAPLGYLDKKKSIVLTSSPGCMSEIFIVSIMNWWGSYSHTK